MRLHEWISPVTIVLRDLAVPDLADGPGDGPRVLRALGFRAGFTHMEWYRKPRRRGRVRRDRRPAARRAHGRPDELRQRHRSLRGWAEAVLHGHLRAPIARSTTPPSCSSARRAGPHPAHRGPRRALAAFGEHIVNIDLLPLGAQRRDWSTTPVSDGAWWCATTSCTGAGDDRRVRQRPAALRRLSGACGASIRAERRPRRAAGCGRRTARPPSRPTGAAAAARRAGPSGPARCGQT